MDINKSFLEAIKKHLSGERVDWSYPVEEAEWLQLFKLAAVHNVVPMVYESVFLCPSYGVYKDKLDRIVKPQVLQTVLNQTIKTSDFLNLYKCLLDTGAKPLVVKGIICRSIYPMPDHRPSTDEDLYIKKNEFKACHEAILSYGMDLCCEGNIEEVYEVSYRSNRINQYIELHKDLFPEDSEAYGEFNEIFKAAMDNAIIESINGVSVYTLEYTDHLMYLICHAFKHFLHSGFGIRQLCDIVLFANCYGSKLNWNRILIDCRRINADIFTAALFDIGQRYLGFSPEKACYPEYWRAITVDSEDLLLELLTSGLYGQSTMSRKHSSNITLNAVAADKKGKRSRFSVLKTIFPGSKSLSGRYGYLKKYPFLLPIAWTHRIVKYKKETVNRGADNSASESIKIGNDRIELLKKYGILKK